KAGLSWPLPQEMTDAALESCLYPPSTSTTGRPPVPLPDWSEVRRELTNKHVTRRIVWEEYRDKQPDGIGYSQYCDRYRQWLRHVDPVMRIDRKAGEKLFVDWSGDPAEFIDPETGEVREAPLFVAVLGTSSHLYAEATRTEQLQDWIMAHVRALTALGAAPSVLVPDNCRTAVTKPCYYEPTLNRTYAEMAAHYGMAILPARIRRPKDKPTAESGVLIAQRAILGRLRNRQFFSLAQLNEAIAVEIDAINQAPFQKLEGSRQSHFEEVDLPAMRPLPQTPYEFAEWLRPRVGVNYNGDLRRRSRSKSTSIRHPIA
ncbi:IS21 family transposase, partial [Rhodothermus sp. AH-315-K08]|nr:IS21 family transposase [Rhodothermus sp. AH-315-K08]